MDRDTGLRRASHGSAAPWLAVPLLAMGAVLVWQQRDAWQPRLEAWWPDPSTAHAGPATTVPAPAAPAPAAVDEALHLGPVEAVPATGLVERPLPYFRPAPASAPGANASPRATAPVRAPVPAPARRAPSADAVPRTASTPAPAPPPLARLSAGPDTRQLLDQMVRSGALRPAGDSELARWRAMYRGASGRSPGERFDSFAAHMPRYVVVRQIELPPELGGANAALFFIDAHTPMPSGDLQHAMLLDLHRGHCFGRICESMLRPD